MSACPGPAGVVGTVTSPFNGWYRRDPCVARKEFRPDRFYLLDGGMGTALEARRPASGSDDPLWSCGMTYTDPDSVRQVHSAFLSAGADIVTTNTYQCSRELFKKHLDLPDPELDSARLFGRALQLADEAVDSAEVDAIVVASVGPYGACQHDGSEYTGEYVDTLSSEDLERWHFERINRLAAAGATFLAVETIPALAEASAILNVVQSFPGLRCWVSFQCRDGKTTAKGEPFDRVVRELLRHPTCPNKLVAVGVNCVAPKDVAPLLRLANRVNRYETWPDDLTFRPLPYVVYPNSGETWEASRQSWSGERGGPDLESDLVRRVPQWMRLGANVIGGCCRVGPEAIALVGQRMRECEFDVFEYRRRHGSVDRRGDFEDIKRRLTEVARLEARDNKEKEVVVPSDLVGKIELLPPGHVDRHVAEARLAAMFQHFGVKYPFDKDDADAEAGKEQEETRGKDQL